MSGTERDVEKLDEPAEPAEPAELPSQSGSNDSDEAFSEEGRRTSSISMQRSTSRLSRIGSAGLERANTTLSTIRSRRPVPPFSHPLTHERTKPDYIVEFDGPDDPYRPLNWAFNKKVMTTALYGFTTMGSTFASSVFSPGINQVANEFNVGSEVSTLGIALLLFGFGLGPLIWAPLSEVYGRKSAVLGPYFIAAIFSFATATAKDIQTVCITR